MSDYRMLRVNHSAYLPHNRESTNFDLINQRTGNPVGISRERCKEYISYEGTDREWGSSQSRKRKNVEVKCAGGHNGVLRILLSEVVRTGEGGQREDAQ